MFLPKYICKFRVLGILTSLFGYLKNWILYRIVSLVNEWSYFVLLMTNWRSEFWKWKAIREYWWTWVRISLCMYVGSKLLLYSLHYISRVSDWHKKEIRFAIITLALRLLFSYQPVYLLYISIKTGTSIVKDTLRMPSIYSCHNGIPDNRGILLVL